MLLRFVLLALPLVAVATLPPPEHLYNFLMLLPAGSISHRNVFMPLASALTQRGHKITMITPFPPADNNPNITYINHGLLLSLDKLNMFDIRDNLLLLGRMLRQDISDLARDFYKEPTVKEIYDKRKEFDLIVIDWSVNELAYPFAHEQKFITITTSGIDPSKSAVQGNLMNPAYVPSLRHFMPPLTFLQRLYNIFLHFQLPMVSRYYIVPAAQVEVDKHFPDLPSLQDIERNQSLSLYNSHFSLDMPLALLPSQVEIGGMHCTTGKPLPKSINDFVSGKEPVIYFSLGTAVSGKSMPSKYQDIFVSVFAKLPYKVLWKFEADRTDISKNVMIQKWMPQQDILAHPNVKLFISHCGLLGTQETMYHGKPVLGLPVIGDQPKNAERLRNKGFGRMIQWEDLTEDLLLSEIHELMTNPKYLNAISSVSSIFRDQPQPPVERAVYWTEYVIRHGGAQHLRSPELDLSWVQLLNLDVILMLHVLVYVSYRIIKKLVGLCYSCMPSTRKLKTL